MPRPRLDSIGTAKGQTFRRTGMSVKAFNAFCGSLPHTTHVVQWGGSDVWKVSTKVFVIGRRINGASRGGGAIAVSFKCSDLAYDILKEQPGLRPAPYLASRGLSWIERTSAQSMDDQALHDYITESHRLVASGLTKTVQRQLGLITT